MKNIILIILSLVMLTACGPRMKKRYTFEVTYTNDKIDTLIFTGSGENLFSLNQSDLKSGTHTLLSGIRTYRVMSIQNLGMQNKKEQQNCACFDLILEPKPKKEIIIE